MNNPLRKWDFDTLFIKGYFEAFAKFARDIPLLNWFCLTEDFDDNRGIAEVVNAQKLRRFSNKFFPRWIIGKFLSNFINN